MTLKLSHFQHPVFLAIVSLLAVVVDLAHGSAVMLKVFTPWDGISLMQGLAMHPYITVLMLSAHAGLFFMAMSPDHTDKRVYAVSIIAGINFIWAAQNANWIGDFVSLHNSIVATLCCLVAFLMGWIFYHFPKAFATALEQREAATHISELRSELESLRAERGFLNKDMETLSNTINESQLELDHLRGERDAIAFMWEDIMDKVDTGQQEDTVKRRIRDLKRKIDGGARGYDRGKAKAKIFVLRRVLELREQAA